MKALGCLILLAMLAAFSHPASATGGLCKWEGGPGVAPSCRSEDCPKDGGTAICTQVEIQRPRAGNNAEGYTYDMCDGINYSSNDVKWCRAAGGTPGTGPDGGAACVDLPEHVLGSMGTYVDDESLTRTIPDKKVGNPTCDQLTVVDSGWGKQPERDPGCWKFNPTYVNGINTSDRRERVYSGHTKASNGTCTVPWTGVIVVRRDRFVQCPLGYGARNRADGDVDCVRQPPCCTTRGDPVQMTTGARVQREDDYQFGDPSGLKVTRYYYSFGFYRPSLRGVSDIATVDDYWRTNYDIRLYKEPEGGLALATIVSPDGGITTFDLAGVPFQNYGGGGDRLRHETDGTWTLLSSASGGRKLFNAAGRLTALVDNNGLQTIVVYDSSGKTGLVEDPYGRQIIFSYAGDRLSSVTTPDGQNISYGYDGAGRLTSVTYPDGATRSYKYENSRFVFLLTGLVDELGAESIFSYDTLGRAIKNSRNGGSFIETYSYGSGTTTYTDALGKKEVMSYAVSGGVNRPTGSTISCSGCTNVVTATTFDGNGNRATSRDANGNLTKYAFDLTTNLETSRTEALKSDGTATTATRSIDTVWDGQLRKPKTITHHASGEPDWAESFTYDENGNILSSSLISGAQSRSMSYSYDAEGRLIRVDGPRTDVQDITEITYFGDNDVCTGCRGQRATVTNAMGHVTTFVAYDRNGRLTEEKNSNGTVTKNTYDLRGRLRTTIQAFGLPAAETNSYSYDLAGKLLTSTTPDGVKAAYGYDALGNLTSVSAPSGSKIVFVRDVKGNVVGQDSFDEKGVLRSRSRTAFDSLDRIVGLIDGYGNRTNYMYDANGNRVSSLSPLGSLSQVQYDAANRGVVQINPDGGKVLASYDSRDSVVAITDPLGHVTSYTYDGLGNRVAVMSPDTGLTTYEYDSAGNVSAMIDARGVRSAYSYDALGRLSSSRSGAGGTNELLTEYIYDEGVGGIGHLTTTKTLNTEVHFAYDPLGRIAMESQGAAPGRTISYSYGDGRLAAIVYPSGMQVRYQYDVDGLVLAVTADGNPVILGASSTPYGALEAYTTIGGRSIVRKRDLNGRVVSATMDVVASDSQSVFNFSYDRNGRLTGAAGEGSKTYAYAYDMNGNRLSFSEDGATSTYRYDIASNKLISATDAAGTSVDYSYDLRGSLVTRATDEFSYDSRGLLSHSAVKSELTYTTDGLGRRVSTGDGTSTLLYAYANDRRVLGTYSQISGVTDVTDETIYVGGIPVALVKQVGGSGPTFYAALTDQVGAVREIVDSVGRSVWRWGGEPFGATPPEESTSGAWLTSNRSRFPGQFFDAESDLNYNIHRDYDSKTGRYIQSDPIGLLGGTNTYIYADGDPLDYVDPLGLVKWSVGITSGGGVVPFMARIPLLNKLPILKDLSGGIGYFNATSECVRGEMGSVDGYVSYTDQGIGLPFGFSGTQATLEDGLIDLDLDALEGRFVNIGVQVLFGAGPSYSALRMGRGRSDFGWSFDGGLSAGAASALGYSKILRKTRVKCGCAS